MGQVLLRRTTKATHSVDEAAALVRTLTNARVVGQSGDNVLTETWSNILPPLALR